MVLRKFEVEHIGVIHHVPIDTTAEPSVRSLRLKLPQSLSELPANLYQLFAKGADTPLSLSDSTSSIPEKLEFRAHFEGATISASKRPRDDTSAESKRGLVKTLNDASKSTQISSVGGGGSSCVLPLVYGTVSRYLTPTEAVQNVRTHKWTAYVRGTKNEDLGGVIEHVVFTLHPTFQNPVRTISRPPFEITEYGWGEFTMDIAIKFYGVAELVVVHHMLLFSIRPSRPEPGHCIPPLGLPFTKQDWVTFTNMPTPVVAETYDEFVFEHVPKDVEKSISTHRDQMAATASAARGVSCWEDISRQGGWGAPGRVQPVHLADPDFDVKQLTVIRDALVAAIDGLQKDLAVGNCANVKL